MYLDGGICRVVVHIIIIIIYGVIIITDNNIMCSLDCDVCIVNIFIVEIA